MSLVTLGLAQEWREHGIAANSLWPRTAIDTAAVRTFMGAETADTRSRTPEITADAANAVLTRDPRECSGRFLIDDEVLAEEGVTDLTPYGGGTDLALDLFLDE
jgi:citronellol/citronellal dehydrogenase